MSTIKILITQTFVGFCVALFYCLPVYLVVVWIGGSHSSDILRNTYIFTGVVASLFLFGKEYNNGQPARKN
jgi:hypothetical protein